MNQTTSATTLAPLAHPLQQLRPDIIMLVQSQENKKMLYFGAGNTFSGSGTAIKVSFNGAKY
ncbi:MAG TPA: hypothetical protein VLB06_02825 [Sulfuricaulis sp.]|nr:hypothetical protein [Sulfuricaulis sp.]